MVERILPEDERVKGLLYLPFNTPEACEEIVRDFGDAKGVIGFAVTAARNRPVHHNRYMRLYAMIEETGKPLAFHSGFHWGDPSFQQLNRFISMHALSFVHYSLIHLTNWVINALPERFPKLKLVWVESGLAWVPFIMQRLDHEFMMRVCEAPNLKRPPSEYIREMYFTSQPLEKSNMKLLEATLHAMNAETQLLFASDWPHWDFDPPSSITTIPFLSDEAKRNILGLNAARVFNLEVKRLRPKAKDVRAPVPATATA
jgi:predicted TIM-barrel fold metal-dependent hydrolase